ncbi:MAG TPA: phosphotransferase [Rhizomicrobium sp.]|nr:phosphotransferase [Rhizomicrobium sp.]
MSQAREPKPAWHDVPAGLRGRVEAIIGDRVVADEIAWGGFGPTATFVLTLAAGRKVFVKGTHPGNTERGHEATLRECRNLRDFAELAAFGPAFLGSAEADGWHLAVLDCVERETAVPPWTQQAVTETMRLIAGFHAATPARAARLLEERSASDLLAQAENWHSLRDADVRARFAALFASPAKAERWLDSHLERLIALKDRAATLDGPRGWMHMDIRSDNLIFGARPVLVDWPVLSFGPQLLDIAFFLPSLEGEDGPRCADGLALYEKAADTRFAADDIAVAAAAVAGFFAARAGEPEIAVLPRLRWVQKLQLFPALDWLCESLGIEALARDI